MSKDKGIQEQNFTDMILERPIDFMVGNDTFYIYPLSLGKMMMMSSLFKDVFRLDDKVRHNPLWSILKSANTDKSKVANILAYYTLKTRDEIFNSALVRKRSELFASKMDEKELTTILTLAMQMDKSEEYIKASHIDLDVENMRRIQKVKENSKSSVKIGGRTIFGQTLDAIIERYGWSYEYVLWDISYACVKLLQVDCVKDIFLSDKEMKSVNLYTGNVINADDKANDELIDKELGLI